MTIDVKLVTKSILTIEIALVLFFVFIYYLAYPVKSEKIIYIEKGSVKKIITQLSKKTHNLYTIDSYIIRMFFGRPQQGWIDIGKEYLTKADYLYALTHAKAALKVVTLLPGETADIFLDSIANKFDLNSAKLHSFYDAKTKWKDGFLVAQTYALPLGIDEERMIDILMHYAQTYHEELAIKIFGDYNEKRWMKYIIIASIVQKEAANSDEMPIVSSVIYNRLEKRMRLQMDGTLNYSYYSHQKVTPYRIRHDLSRFNTYKYEGIPPYPICAVNSDAIKAAIAPSKTDYLYFMRNKNGIHDFSRYYSTHIKNIVNVKNSNIK